MATTQNHRIQIKKQGKQNQLSKYDRVASQFDSKNSVLSKRQLERQMIMQPKPYQLKGTTLDLKQQTIKQLDDKISSILTKYDQQNKPLTQRNHLQSRKDIKSAIQSVVVSKILQYDPKVTSQLKLAQKSQTLRVRQRSKLIFDKKQSNENIGPEDQLKSKYDIQIQILNQKIKKAQETKKKLNIQPSYSYLELQAKINKGKSISKNQQEIRNRFMSNREVTPLSNINQKIVYDFKEVPKYYQKKEITKNANSENIQIRQLAEAFSTQAAFDQQLRNLKIWFTFSNQSEKWKRLQEKLLLKKYIMSSQFCRSVFQSSIEQHNPFYRWNIAIFEEGIEKLISAYSQSQNNWDRTIKNHWNKKQLKEESLKQQILSQSNRPIQIEDLVQFTNHQTGKYLRNRDLWLIFKRLTCKCSNKLSLIGLIEQITSEQASNS